MVWPMIAAAVASAVAGAAANKFFSGSPEKRENVSRLRPEQEQLYKQAVKAGMKPGAGGAFGTAADYYRNLLSNNEYDYNQFAAPQLRQYNEEIVPGLSEQFAGMGAGGLSSSGFRNAQIQGATDLAERLGAIRANLRNSGAQGLTNIGQIGLQNYSQNMTTEHPTEGFLSSIAPAVGQAGANALSNWLSPDNNTSLQPGGISTGSPTPASPAPANPAPAFPAGGISAGNASTNWMSPNYGNNVGRNTSPYGGGPGPQASPRSGMGGLQLPNNIQAGRF